MSSLELNPSVLSQKFAYKALARAVFSQPRQGRNPADAGPAQALGEGPHPVPRLRDTPLPVATRDRGDGGEGGLADPRLAPWATLFRPDKSGLTSSTNF